eukprot:765990-Hanusia_phi.AAC.2
MLRRGIRRAILAGGERWRLMHSQSDVNEVIELRQTTRRHVQVDPEMREQGGLKFSKAGQTKEFSLSPPARRGAFDPSSSACLLVVMLIADVWNCSKEDDCLLQPGAQEGPQEKKVRKTLHYLSELLRVTNRADMNILEFANAHKLSLLAFSSSISIPLGEVVKQNENLLKGLHDFERVPELIFEDTRRNNDQELDKAAAFGTLAFLTRMHLLQATEGIMALRKDLVSCFANALARQHSSAIDASSKIAKMKNRDEIMHLYNVAVLKSKKLLADHMQDINVGWFAVKK